MADVLATVVVVAVDLEDVQVAISSMVLMSLTLIIASVAKSGNSLVMRAANILSALMSRQPVKAERGNIHNTGAVSSGSQNANRSDSGNGEREQQHGGDCGGRNGCGLRHSAYGSRGGHS